MNPQFWLPLACWIATACSLVAQPILSIDRASGPVRVTWEAEPDFEYRLEETPSLAGDAPWNFLATLASPGAPLSWTDAQSRQGAQRFYRTVQLPPAPSVLAPDFRLLDQQGRTRRLYYYFGAPGARSVVLIFTRNGCA